jgi:hypothetical protein
VEIATPQKEGAQDQGDKGPSAQNTNREVADIHDLMSYLNETHLYYERELFGILAEIGKARAFWSP